MLPPLANAADPNVTPHVAASEDRTDTWCTGVVILPAKRIDCRTGVDDPPFGRRSMANSSAPLGAVAFGAGASLRLRFTFKISLPGVRLFGA